MAHKQPQQHNTRSRFRMSRAAKPTLSKIHKTVTCNADFSTYDNFGTSVDAGIMSASVKSLSLGLDFTCFPCF